MLFWPQPPELLTLVGFGGIFAAPGGEGRAGGGGGGGVGVGGSTAGRSRGIRRRKGAEQARAGKTLKLLTLPLGSEGLGVGGGGVGGRGGGEVEGPPERSTSHPATLLAARQHQMSLGIHQQRGRRDGVTDGRMSQGRGQ